MTLQEFKNIKIGDGIAFPDKYTKGKFWTTEVTEINKKDQTLEVFMRHGKFYSYKSARLSQNVPAENWSYSVGLIKDNYASRFLNRL